MNLEGRLMVAYVPEPIRRRALHRLFEATAAAFEVPVPSFQDGSADRLLAQYAVFTARQAKAALVNKEETARIRWHLYRAAYEMGSDLRQQLEIRSVADAMAVAGAVYRMLRIDFRGDVDGDVVVPACFFSRIYSAPVCAVMSALDQGLLSGLSGGGRLRFQQRITEGAPCCLATLTFPRPVGEGRVGALREEAL